MIICAVGLALLMAKIGFQVLKSMHDPTLGLASAMTNLSPVNLTAVLDRSPAHDMMSPGKGMYRATSDRIETRH
jgi:hypothetical protein